MMFKKGKLYVIMKRPDEEGSAFKAGVKSKHFYTASGYDNFQIVHVPDKSILLYLGVVEHNMVNSKSSYSFLFGETIIILKKEEVESGGCIFFEEVGHEYIRRTRSADKTNRKAPPRTDGAT